jgi:hypothetical protein
MTWQFPTNSKAKNIQSFTLTKSDSYILVKIIKQIDFTIIKIIPNPISD